MVDTYILKINRNIGRDDFNNLLYCVSEEKKERINRFYKYEDAQRTLLGDVLARYAICKRLGAKNVDLIFDTNEYGKPILQEPTGINFNISHSGDCVVCAVDNNAVGIDVETIKPIDLKIAERFFSKDEYLSLINRPEEAKLKYFYMLWTLKESYIKMEGKGLGIPLNSFTISIKGNDISVSINDKVQECFFRLLIIDNTVICSVCTQNNNINESIRWGKPEDFLKEVKTIVLS